MKQYIGPAVIGLLLLFWFGSSLIAVPKWAASWFRSAPEEVAVKQLEQKVKAFEVEKKKVLEEIRIAKAKAAREAAIARAAADSALQFKEKALQLEQRLKEVRQQESAPVKTPEEAFKRLEDLGWLIK